MLIYCIDYTFSYYVSSIDLLSCEYPPSIVHLYNDGNFNELLQCYVEEIYSVDQGYPARLYPATNFIQPENLRTLRQLQPFWKNLFRTYLIVQDLNFLTALRLPDC